MDNVRRTSGATPNVGGISKEITPSISENNLIRARSHAVGDEHRIENLLEVLLLYDWTLARALSLLL